ncbi:hypothetical protein QT13_17420 [Pectobacterium brasiliense]|nr:hypothetical protein QT13_17420 [Pectobacterium brasiliense]KHS87310.1 hypothetical protein RC83_11870 [Pectobacterium brasiliense]
MEQRDPSQEQAYAFILVEKFVGYTVPDDKGSQLAPFNRHSIEGIYSSYFKLHVRWLRSLTRITYLSKLIGIHSLAALRGA